MKKYVRDSYTEQAQILTQSALTAMTDCSEDVLWNG